MTVTQLINALQRLILSDRDKALVYVYNDETEELTAVEELTVGNNYVVLYQKKDKNE